MNKTAELEVDPVTLSYPEKEVYVYDWSNRKKIIFDAKSLANCIETRLLYHEYGFPMPLLPRNPRNNVDFNYTQLISIYYQLRAHGELMWGLTTLRRYNFNKHRWHQYHKSALTMSAISSCISLLDSTDARELFSDFIFARMEELDIPITNYMSHAYQVAMIKWPNHWYLERLKPIAILYYEAKHFGQTKERTINTRFQEIYKKQPDFFQDLLDKNLIK